MLSRVDGIVTAREIGYATSLSEDQVEQCLLRLESLGAVRYAGRASRLPNERVAATVTATPQPEQAAAAGASHARDVPDNPRYDPAELDAPSDLDPERRHKILDLYHRLESLDHYELLGIERGADRRAVKAAYYERVKLFHPDRYFGKDLGPFRAKLERCFACLTAAHDTLASAASREEYDAYLEAQRATQEFERAMAQTITVDDLDQLEQQMALAFAAQSSASALLHSLGANSPVARNEPVIDIAPSQPPPESGTAAKMSDDERRRFLARKLRVSSASLRAAPRGTSPPVASSPPPSREQIADQLRRQLGGAKREDNKKQLENQLAAAETAMAAKDPVSASNALRVAQSLAPNDPAIAERLAHAQALAAATLSDTYLRQAEYEEKSGRFEAAARSYERAARGKPTAAAWEAAARCLLEAQVDLRAAAEFARISVSLNPERAASHLLLGRIFLAAGMRTSAIAELERARRLDLNNDTVLSLLKRIANGEI